MSAIGTCVQPGFCVCWEAGSMPGWSSQGGWLWWPAALPRRSSLLMLCPELIPQGSEVLSGTMKPNNLSPLHRRKNPAALGVFPPWISRRELTSVACFFFFPDLLFPLYPSGLQWSLWLPCNSGYSTVLWVYSLKKQQVLNFTWTKICFCPIPSMSSCRTLTNSGFCLIALNKGETHQLHIKLYKDKGISPFFPWQSVHEAQVVVSCINQ